MAPEVTADLSVIDDAENLISLLALGEDEPATVTEVVTDFGGLEAIFKAGTAGQAVRQLAPLLQRLLAFVNGMKKLGDAPLPPALASQLKGMVGALNLLAGKGKTDPAEKVDAGQLQKATQALEKLVALVNRLKEQDAGAELGEKEASELGAIASLLNSLAGAVKPDGDEKAGDEKVKEPPPADDKEKATKNDDPIVIFKAGAKMRKARLSQFRKAVDVLNSLLKELEGEPPEEKDKDKKKTTKTEEEPPAKPDHSPELIAKIEELATKVAEATNGVVDLAKRVEGIENIRPTGEDDDPPAPVEKKKSLWSGLI